MLSPWLGDQRPEWDRAVGRWLEDAGRSLELGPVQAIAVVKERPWSLVLRVTYARRDCYFKACGAAGQHEPALLQWLAAVGYTGSPETLAVEKEQGWILSADAGVPVQEVLDSHGQARAFAPVLAGYATLQITSAAHIDTLLGLGLPDRRLSRLPALLEDLLEQVATGRGYGPTPIEPLRTAIARRLPEFERRCHALATWEYATALDHGDLHRGNLYVRDGRSYLGDWGDACLTHPFCSLMLPLETLLSQLPPAERAAAGRYLRDAYLEPWQAMAGPAQLQADFRRALWAGHAVRALNFAHMFQGADEATLNHWKPTIIEQLEAWIGHGDPGDVSAP